MGLIITKYNKEKLTDESWYDSSTIYYSKCYDKKDDYKELEITFKDGRTYLYKKLTVQDYLLFKNSESQGKALNKYITCKKDGKPKYEYDKLEKVDIANLELKKELLIEERNNERL